MSVIPIYDLRIDEKEKVGFFQPGGWEVFIILFLALILTCQALAVNLPGTDVSSKLEAAGTLLRLIDTAIFKWGTRIFAGLCICGAGWALKEQRFGACVLCVIAAIILGTAPTWVKNIFSIGGGDSIFSYQMTVPDPKERTSYV